MDDNLAIFLVMAVAIAGAVALIVLTRWVRIGQHELAGTVRLENEALRGEVMRLQDRLATLERLDDGPRAARELENLRRART